MTVLIIAAVLFALAAAALYAAPKTVEYTLSSPKIITNVKIVFLSDTHGRRFGEREKCFLALARSEKADILVLGGDITDEKTSADYLEKFLCEMQDIAQLRAVVSGNHEMNMPKTFERYKKVYEENGINVLHGNFIEFANIRLYGIVSPRAVSRLKKTQREQDETRKAIEELGELDKSFYNILIAHRPEFINEYENSAFDAVISGHAHGGQVRIPFLLNGLFAPNQGIFPRRAGGKYSGAVTQIVGRGLSYNPLRPRVFNRCEVVSITLSPPLSLKVKN
ncbi:MAG: metallophosphoesterase [Clostridia bacterium]|nr:metallophosphoesterase [Clostridia bacterium]